MQNGECDKKALVQHWRVLYCEHEEDEHDNEVLPNHENKIEKTLSQMKVANHNKRHLIGVEGSGSAISDSDDEDTAAGGMEYYEDNDNLVNGKLSTSPCVNHLYDISASNGKILIRNLKECTLYTVDVSPADATGRAIQPSEQFGSVHSTLCPVGVGGPNEDGESSGFWFGDENRLDQSHSKGTVMCALHITLHIKY